MEHLISQKNIAALTQSRKAHYYLIKLTQLLVSVSVCSFLFSPSSLFVLLHYFKFYFSTFPFQLFTHNIDKNCMFLLCNGLLVFVGITRSFFGSSDGDDEPSKYDEDGSQSQFPDVEASEPILENENEEKTSERGEQKRNTAAEQAIEIMYTNEEVEQNNEKIILEVQESNEKIILIDEKLGQGNKQSALKEEEEVPDEESELSDVGDGEEDKGSEVDYFLLENSLEEEEVEENWMISTEELNKKFDDFIRRMREDLRIEAQRQLIMV